MSIETQIETYRGVVYPWQMDQMDHMNVQFYTARFDQARLAPVCRARNAYALLQSKSTRHGGFIDTHEGSA